MLAFSNDYYGLNFRAKQSVELFCAYVTTDYLLGLSDVKRDLTGQLKISETLDEYYDLIEVYKKLDRYDQELVWSILQIVRKNEEKRMEGTKDDKCGNL